LPPQIKTKLGRREERKKDIQKNFQNPKKVSTISYFILVGSA
jgi:hypothetical protein